MKKLIFTLIAVALFIGQLYAQNAFKEGNIIVCRIGNGSEVLDSTKNTVWLDEYNVSTTPATLLQSVAVKSGSDTLKYGGLQTYGGYLSRSADSLYITFAGFTGTSPTIAVVDGSVNIDLSTRMDASFGAIRGVASLDGDSLWITSGKNNSGLYFLKKGASDATKLTANTTDYIFNSPKIYNRNLYLTNENNYVFDMNTFLVSGTNSGLWYLDKALPVSEVNFYQSCSTFDFYDSFNTDFMMTGNKVAYLADLSSTYGISKFYDGSSKGSIGIGGGKYYGITEYSADKNSGIIVFYATRKNTNGSYDIIRVTDKGGYASAPNATIEVVATAPVGTVLRGMALAPKGGVEKLVQTISYFNDTTTTNGDAGFKLKATATSGETISYTSTNSSVAVIKGDTVTITGAGITQIIAYNAGNATYKEVSDTITLTVFPGVSTEPVAFTEGNILVCRIGNGSEAMDSTKNTVWLDEYNVSTTPATLLQSVAVKSGSDTLKYGGLQTYGGYLSRSADSLYLTMSGFVNNSPSIAVLDGSVNIDLSTQFKDSLFTIRSAASTDGKDIWFTTATNDFKGGLFYAEKGASSATRVINEVVGTNFCTVHIIDSTLFMNNERNYVDPYYKKSSLWYQSQLPKTLTSSWNTTITTNMTTGTDFMMTGSYASATNKFYRAVTYVADTTSATRGIVKYVRTGDYPNSYKGIIGKGTGQFYGITDYSFDDATETVVFYATRRNTNGSYDIIRVTDKGGYAAAPNATIEVVASAPSGTVLRGMTLAPKGGVAKLAQTISGFSDLTLTDQDADFELTATTNSGLNVMYGSLDNSVVSIDGKTIHVEGLGTTKIIAFNLGNNIYKTFVDTINVTVSASTLPDQVIGNFNDTTVVYGNTLVLAATAPGGEVTYKLGNTEIVTISGSTLTPLKTGTVTVTASQDGGGSYKAATKEITVTVIKADQLFSNLGDITAKFAAPDTTIAPVVTSGGAITYSSRNTAVATISDKALIHFAGVGSTYLVLSQAGNDNYNEASDSILVTVNKATQTISNFTDITKTYGDKNFALTAMTSSGLDIIYTVANKSVAIVSGTTVKIVGAGTTTITASQAGNDNYGAATDVTATLTVSKASQTISGLSNLDKTVGDADFDLSATATSSLAVTYNSSNENVATINGSTVHIVGAGATNITASQAGNDNYNAATDVTVILTVTPITGVGELHATLPVRIQNNNLIVSVQAGSVINIYNVLGVCLQSKTAEKTETVISNLPKGQILIVRSGKAVAKVIL